MNKNWNTQDSLILRAQNPYDEKAWDDFVGFYESFVKMVLRKVKIHCSDEEDLVQTIILNLWKNLPKYKKGNARFRTWLSTVIRNTAINDLRKCSTESLKRDRFSEDLETVSVPRVEMIIDEEWDKYIINLAMEKVEKRFDGQAMEAFKLSLKGKNVRQIAQTLNLKENTIYTLRSRVKRRLKQEVYGLSKRCEINL
ncbi:MAG: sigma-70 family RNA polymerase sigma factor [Lentisphaeraceae bacterium]|nr:sigma-70 family RNA polymerase sigma factor [Lentisphaeraceae bacterium]